MKLKPPPGLARELEAAYRRVMDSGQFIGGYEVEAFEAEWAAYCGAKYCVSCGNGFDALQMAIRAVDSHAPYIQVDPKTFIASWQAVRVAGSTPFPPEYPAGCFRLIVHLYGIIQEPPSNNQWTYIVEDCAQAHGATYNGTKAGRFGIAGCWSFYPTKNLGCYGDGGAVTTDNIVIAEKIREIKNYGQKGEGINSRLDALQAAFLRVKLPYLDGWNAVRSRNAAEYQAGLADLPGVGLPHIPAGSQPAWYDFAISARRRDELKAFLEERGVATMIHYPDHPYHMIYGGNLPEADEWCKTTLSLPVAPHVTLYDIEYVIDRIREFYAR